MQGTTIVLRYDGEAIGFVDTNRSLTLEEALELAGIDIDEMIDVDTPRYNPDLLDMEYTRTLTDAERVSAMLADDGQRWYTQDGRHLHDLATERGAYTEQHPEKHYLTRYAFEDGSAIVASEGAWDIEGAEPWSWQCEE